MRTPAAATPLRKVPENRLSMQDVRRQLIARGYQEAITYSFVEPLLQKALDPEVEPLPLLNPISADMSVMRTNLWAGLVQAADYNLKRQQPRVRLFETGLRFVPSASGLQQIPTLAFCGHRVRVCRKPGRMPMQPSISLMSKAIWKPCWPVVATTTVTALWRCGIRLCTQDKARRLKKAGADGQWHAVGLIGALHPSVQKQLGIPSAFISGPGGPECCA